MNAHIWDISPPLDSGSAVFTGDAAYEQTLRFALSPDCPVNVHTISLSPHTGAHADAPLHYAAVEPRTPGRRARTSGELPLEPYLGPARVIHARGLDESCAEKRIGLAHIQHGLGDIEGRALPARVLIRSRPVASQSWDDFWAIAGDLIKFFAAKNIVLIGFDTPSVDSADSKDLPSHQALLRHDMRVLENLVLDEVAEGDYELIALPLKLTQCDASPVRAVLRALPDSRAVLRALPDSRADSRALPAAAP
jgi:arylformamidase